MFTGGQTGREKTPVFHLEKCDSFTSKRELGAKCTMSLVSDCATVFNQSDSKQITNCGWVTRVSRASCGFYLSLWVFIGYFPIIWLAVWFYDTQSICTPNVIKAQSVTARLLIISSARLTSRSLILSIARRRIFGSVSRSPFAVVNNSSTLFKESL